MKYGYARCSTEEQNINTQIDLLTQFGCTVIRQEKVSGSSMNGREELKTLLQFLRPNDTLVVTRIDRLARSVRDLQNIVFDLDSRGVHLVATEQPIDTSTSVGRCFLQMLSVFAEFETNLRKERQAEGIAKAKARGVYKGRKPSAPNEQIRQMKSDGVSVSTIARELNISRTTVYRALGNI